MALVCKKCGFKQSEESVVEFFRKTFEGLEEEDVPYFCGACMENASQSEYAAMMNCLRYRR